MAKIVTLGEIMLRLSPPGYQRFAQASDFEINYGGARQMLPLPLLSSAMMLRSFPRFLPMPLETQL